MARLAEADALAARGCYLCLKEAAAVYERLLEVSDDPGAVRNALETYLMLALREVELRIPDSGAYDSARALQARVPADYEAYFAGLDSLGGPPAGGAGSPERRQQREARIRLATELEREWPASAMKAYFYLAAALHAGLFTELKPQVDAMRETHGQDLSIEYRMLAFLPWFSEEAARALIGRETGFGEVHFLLGQRAVLDARLADAHRELSRARELLPDSAAIVLVLAHVSMAYARYADALSQYDRVLASGPDPAAELGRAKALSYLGRHADAIGVLDGLLADLRNNPGEKYYWRAWNHLRSGQTQAAHVDAIAALQAMRNNDVYRLAGIASFHLDQLGPARTYFDSALEINGADCDAQRYLGQIDAVERRWSAAFARFTSAVGCYDLSLARLATELAGHEQDISGLSNGLIASLRTELQEVQGLRAVSAQNAAQTASNAGRSAP